MISKLADYYNGQYTEDKVIIWLFMFFEVFTLVLGLILFLMYIFIRVLYAAGPD